MARKKRFLGLKTAPFWGTTTTGYDLRIPYKVNVHFRIFRRGHPHPPLWSKTLSPLGGEVIIPATKTILQDIRQKN